MPQAISITIAAIDSPPGFARHLRELAIGRVANRACDNRRDVIQNPRFDFSSNRERVRASRWLQPARHLVNRLHRINRNDGGNFGEEGIVRSPVEVRFLRDEHELRTSGFRLGNAHHVFEA